MQLAVTHKKNAALVKPFLKNYIKNMAMADIVIYWIRLKAKLLKN
jgi:hypothetical protein